MAVKISKLFKNVKFQNLSNTARLLYIYLATNSNLNTVGVFSPNLEIVRIESGCNEDNFRSATQELVKTKFIYVKKYDSDIYFIIPEHFNTIPKSEASILKIQKIMKSLPNELVLFLNTIGIKTSAKVKEFIEPLPKEVSDYALSLGYLINGEDFVSYYKGQADKFGKDGIWVDTRGKQVHDWKAKVRKVWCKDERKLKTIKTAPEGFESFYVRKDGKVIQPDGWKNGKPYSKSLPIDILLKREYEKRKANS